MAGGGACRDERRGSSASEVGTDLMGQPGQPLQTNKQKQQNKNKNQKTKEEEEESPLII